MIPYRDIFILSLCSGVNEFNEVIDKYSKLPIDKCVSDIRANDLNVESIWSGNKEVDALFGGLIGAMGMYELNPNGVLEIIRVNDGYYDLFGSIARQCVF